MTLFVWPPQNINTTGLATEAKQDDIITAVDGVETLIGSTNTKLDTIAGYVDQIEGYVDGIETLVGTTNTNTAAITTRLNEMGAGLVTAKHDSLYPTFNATSDVWVYKLAAATVATLTINYTDATKAVITSIVRT